MNKKLIPNKNHKAFLKELCNLIKDYDSIGDYRDKDEIAKMLSKRLPKILNNFDKTDPMYEPVSIILFDIFQNLGTALRFIKEEK